MVSTAVGTERVAKVIGYELKKGVFNESTPNLPMRIAIFGQANTANQGDIDDTPTEVTSAKQAADKYGYGSMIHLMMRILRSRFGDITGGIPTVIYPQMAPGGGTAQADLITITGTADKGGTHFLRINGRTIYDGDVLQVNIEDGDDETAVATKVADAINNCLGCPVTASAAAGVVTVTCKWVGVESAGLNVSVDVGDDNLSLTYAVTEDTAGSGSSSTNIQTSLDKFGDVWNTIVVNPYDQATTNSIFEAFNGIAGEVPASGRYTSTIWKPFVCLSGSLVADSVANVLTNLDNNENTIVQCPAPNSDGWAFEAAANFATLLARQAQDDPHLDISGKSLPDMPTPNDGDAGIYTKYNDRDAIVKGGGSTVILVDERYKVEDFITTYNVDGENPPQFRYVRSLIQDWNIRYGVYLLEAVNVVDKSIAENDQALTVESTIKPKQWRQILKSYADELAARNIIVDAAFMQDSILVATGDTNPDRFETSFKYKRSPFARISSTTAEAGFAFNLIA